MSNEEPKNLSNIDKLFTLEVYSHGAEEDKIFLGALKDELIFHYENNRMYRSFCDKKGFSPYSDFGIEDIPPVSVSVFKNLGDSLGSVPINDIKLKLQSSATSGVPSTVVVDKITSKRQSKSMVKVMQSFIGNKLKPFLVMDIDPRSQQGGLLGARFAAVSGYLKFSNKTGFFLKSNENGMSYFDVEAMRDFLGEVGEVPVVLFGFTYILYANVLKAVDAAKIKLQLPQGSKIIHIGGWKKLESEKISKEEFNKRLSECFGLAPSDVIDIYGFTEQMGLNYPDHPDGWKHTAVYSRVLVRDPMTHELLPPGKEGMLEFVSPIPHSYPGNAVLTDDLGIVCDDGNGIKFKITGRMKKAEVRGCGDILSQKLTFQKKIAANEVENESLNILLYEGKITSGTSLEQLREIIDDLNGQRDWLHRQPAEAILGLISKVAGSWIQNPKLQHLKNKGLLFVSSWCDEKHLRSISELGLHGNLKYLDTFCSFPESEKHLMRANARGLVCHWLAGNVQILGLFALVQAMISKNVNLLRVSAKDEGVFKSILETFRGAEYTTSDGFRIKGDDLLKTVAVVYFPHRETKLGQEMSRYADVRIAWGGNEAIEAVTNYPSKIGSETILFGPKLSFTVIGKDALESLKEAKKLARRLSVDVSVFDQTGCASPHNLFIEEGGAVSVDEFLSILAEEMKKTENQIPNMDYSIEQISQIHSIRGVYDFKGKVFGSDAMSWTLLVENSSELPRVCSPIYSRVLFVHPIKSIFECIDMIDEGIQSIGLAASMDRKIEFANQATAKGVERLPEIGRMLNFEMPWDGVFLYDRLVRWNTLGGPLR